MPAVRILIADDHELLRTGLRRVIEGEPDMEVVAEAGDAPATLTQVAASRPDLVLLDVAMPGGGGIAALRAIRERWPRIKVLMVTMYDDHAHLRLALDAGASGYVIKSAPASEVVTAIRTVSGGRIYVSPCLDDDTVAFPASAGGRAAPALTPREREVVAMVAHGHTSRAIAQQLELSVKTVESYRAKAMEKLGLEGRAELVSYALAAGLLVPGPDDHAG